MMNKYNFDDLVKVISNKNELLKINNRIGIIRGISQSEDNPNVYAYAVDILDHNNEIEDGWFIFEEDLQPTGKMANLKNFNHIESVKVYVDPETGEGKLYKE